jgi:hypothetical protein
VTEEVKVDGKMRLRVVTSTRGSQRAVDGNGLGWLQQGASNTREVANKGQMALEGVAINRGSGKAVV